MTAPHTHGHLQVQSFPRPALFLLVPLKKTYRRRHRGASGRRAPARPAGRPRTARAGCWDLFSGVLAVLPPREAANYALSPTGRVGDPLRIRVALLDLVDFSGFSCVWASRAHRIDDVRPRTLRICLYVCENHSATIPGGLETFRASAEQQLLSNVVSALPVGPRRPQ